MKLNPKLYYYCQMQKNPQMAKIRRYCSRVGCRHLKSKPRKNLIQIGEAA